MGMGLARAVESTKVGSLGPKGMWRHHFRYYDALFFAAVQYEVDAKLVIEVGWASDPFVRHLNWIDE